MPNKVKYGLKNVHFSNITFGSDGTPTFATPVAIPGAVNISLSKQGDSDTFYADDGVYFEVANEAGYEGDLEIALIPEAFRTGPLGETLDNKGVLVESTGATKGHFALLFEFAADAKAIRHVLYNCTASQNEVAGETKGENTTVQTEKLNIKAKPLPDGKLKAKTGDTPDNTTYEGWYDSVYLTAAASQSGGSGTTT